MVMLDNSWSIGKTNYAFQKEFLFKFIERLGILVLYGCFFEVVLVVFVVSTSVTPWKTSLDPNFVKLSVVSYSGYAKERFNSLIVLCVGGSTVHNCAGGKLNRKKTEFSFKDTIYVQERDRRKQSKSLYTPLYKSFWQPLIPSSKTQLKNSDRS